MMHSKTVLLTTAIFLLLGIALNGVTLHGDDPNANDLNVDDLNVDDNWPQFRGRQSSGVGKGRPPRKWNVETGKNVEWKTELLGLGHSGPIVWGDRVIVTTAINSLNERPSLAKGWSGGAGEPAEETGEWTWRVICLDLNTGKQIWSSDAT
ncbi:MAG: outer membrane protein assembly factor BamB, partial [Pirellulaceae bacterium]